MKHIIFLITLALSFSGIPAEGGRLTFLRPADYQPQYPLLPEYSQIRTIDLSGNWEYSTVKGEYTGSVKIPASWQDFTGRVTFTRKFKISPVDSGKKAALVFEGLSRRCFIRLNDEVVAKNEGPYIYHILQSKLLKYERSNILEIEVDNTLHPFNTIPLRNGMLQPQNYGGITGDVFILLYDKAALKNLQLQPELSEDGAKGFINLQVELDILPTETLTGSLIWQITDPAGKVVFRNALPLSGAAYQDKAALNNPLLWGYLQPNLYTVEVYLETAEGISRLSAKKTGFRRAKWEEGFILNGKKVRLQGITYFPLNQFGRTIPAEAMRSDMQMILQSGANAIFLTEPGPNYLYYLCDSLGIMALQSSALNGVPPAIFKKEYFRLALENHIKDMTTSLAHHPSICAWIAARNADIDTPFEQIFRSFQPYHQIPCFIEIKARQNYFVLIDGEGGKSSRTGIYSEVGVCSYGQGENVQTRQAENYMNLLHSCRESNGVILLSFADYWTEHALLFAGESADSRLYRAGLVDVHRDAKLIFHRLPDAWQLESAVLISPANPPEPVFFPIGGLVMIILFLLYYRSNKIFRQQIKRVFAHLHGFFIDVRSGRFIAKTQTAVIGGGAALTIAFILEIYFYHARLSPKFNFILGHLLPQASLQELAVKTIWSPLQSILILFIAVLIVLFISEVLFKITTAIFGGKTEFYKCSVVLQWSTAPVLLLLLLTIMFYKALSYHGLKTVFTAVCFIILGWIYFRIVYGIKAASRGSIIAVFLIFTLLNLIICAIITGWVQYNTAFLFYVKYFFSSAIW